MHAPLAHAVSPTQLARLALLVLRCPSLSLLSLLSLHILLYALSWHFVCSILAVEQFLSINLRRVVVACTLAEIAVVFAVAFVAVDVAYGIHINSHTYMHMHMQAYILFVCNLNATARRH